MGTKNLALMITGATSNLDSIDRQRIQVLFSSQSALEFLSEFNSKFNKIDNKLTSSIVTNYYKTRAFDEVIIATSKEGVFHSNTAMAIET